MCKARDDHICLRCGIREKFTEEHLNWLLKDESGLPGEQQDAILGWENILQRQSETIWHMSE